MSFRNEWPAIKERLMACADRDSILNKFAEIAEALIKDVPFTASTAQLYTDLVLLVTKMLMECNDQESAVAMIEDNFTRSFMRKASYEKLYDEIRRYIQEVGSLASYKFLRADLWRFIFSIRRDPYLLKTVLEGIKSIREEDDETDARLSNYQDFIDRLLSKEMIEERYEGSDKEKYKNHEEIIKLLLSEYSQDATQQLKLLLIRMQLINNKPKVVELDFSIVKNLLEQGANPNFLYEGWIFCKTTLFGQWIYHCDKNPGLVDVFLDHGAKFEIDHAGKPHSVLEACRSPSMAEYLVEKGAALNCHSFVSTKAFYSDKLFKKMLIENIMHRTFNEEEFFNFLEMLFQRPIIDYGNISFTHTRSKIIERLLDVVMPLSKEAEDKFISCSYILTSRVTLLREFLAAAKERRPKIEAELKFSKRVYALLLCYLSGKNEFLNRHWLPPELMLYIAKFLGDTPDLAHRRNQIDNRVQTIFGNINRMLDNRTMLAGEKLKAAIKSNKPDEVQQLLDEGIDVNARDANGKRPLYHAIKVGNVAIFAAMMLKRPQLQLKDLYLTQSMLFWLGYFDRREWLKKLSPKSYNDPHFYSRLLRETAKRGQTELMQALLKRGADILWKNEKGETALKVALSHQHIKTAIFLFEAGDYSPLKEVMHQAMKPYKGGRAGANRVYSLMLDINNSSSSFTSLAYLHRHLTRIEHDSEESGLQHLGNLFNHSFDTYLLHAIYKNIFFKHWLFAGQCPVDIKTLESLEGRKKFRRIVVAKLEEKLPSITSVIKAEQTALKPNAQRMATIPRRMSME